MPRLEILIKAQAYGLGFDLAGVTSLGAVGTAKEFDHWIEQGYAGEMKYLPNRAETRRDSRLPFPGASSAIVVAMNYGGVSPSGPIARYARGADYHDVMIDRLRALGRWLEGELGRSIRSKAYVDTGPLLERDLARKAGLGWFGKNTNLIHPKLGSFFFLGALLVELDLTPDAPFDADRCGSCRRCLDACPTGAFVDERVLDATRCISYLTIEAKGPIPPELREGVGDLAYGCDICQDVCPWNRFSRPHQEPAFVPPPELEGFTRRDWVEMTAEVFQKVFKNSPLKRAKFEGLQRNVTFVTGADSV
ncbi:MAG: tRNA epoxyqueuosine(34) reductase QueG [Sphingobacteriaceae bacterium]|nr:tRNA epoxyqueuosine(34) reductase QueG [Cytophagaceae bacterium]